MSPKRPSESIVHMTEIVQPGDTNAMGNIFGGRVVSMMDVAGAIAAMRHCRRPVVTASIDRVDFHSPIRTGYIVNVLASVNYTGRTSLEVGVRLESEHPVSGERRHTSSAYLTFVSLDDLGHATPVPPLAPETDDEKRRYEQGRRRREERLQRLRAETAQPAAGDEIPTPPRQP